MCWRARRSPDIADTLNQNFKSQGGADTALPDAECAGHNPVRHRGPAHRLLLVAARRPRHPRSLTGYTRCASSYAILSNILARELNCQWEQSISSSPIYSQIALDCLISACSWEPLEAHWSCRQSATAHLHMTNFSCVCILSNIWAISTLFWPANACKQGGAQPSKHHMCAI